MSREKQIEEIARDICECYSDGICYQDDNPCDLKCESMTDAQYLYEKGYRKASDIFAEIDNLVDRYMNSFGYSFGDLVYELEELKKKYTESEGKE